MSIKNGQQFSLAKAVLSLPLRFKISIPYLIVASLFAGLATFMVGRSFVSTLEDRFRRQLEEAYFRAVDEVINIEAAQLKIFRTISFTLGVPEAVTNHDVDQLSSLVYPQIANNQLHNVMILDETGKLIISWQRQEGTANYSTNLNSQVINWAVVNRVVAADFDEKGDKFVQLIDTPQGLILYTVGPIRTTDDQLGILMIGSPITKVVQNLALTSLANVTFYDDAGEVVFSSFGNRNLSTVESTIRGNTNCLLRRHEWNDCVMNGMLDPSPASKTFDSIGIIG